MENPKTVRSTFNLLDLLSHLIQGWRLLVIGIVAGGLLGWLSTTLIKPVYESTAVFTFVIDYARTGLLTDIEEDQVLEVAGDLIKSTDVLEMVKSQASSKGIVIDESILTENFTTERRFNQWLLKVQASEPDTAVILANLWSQVSLAEFQKASLAATKADGLNRFILSLETCYQQSTSGQVAQPLCQASDRKKLQTELENAGVDLQHWMKESRGLFAGLNYSIAREAVKPQNPIQHSRGTLILAGGLAGMLTVSLLLLFTHPVK